MKMWLINRNPNRLKIKNKCIRRVLVKKILKYTKLFYQWIYFRFFCNFDNKYLCLNILKTGVNNIRKKDDKLWVLCNLTWKAKVASFCFSFESYPWAWKWKAESVNALSLEKSEAEQKTFTYGSSVLLLLQKRN